MPPPPDADDTRTDDTRTDDDELGERKPLVCMLDDVEVGRERPRCLRPTSQCRFRDWCEVTVLARRRRKEESNGRAV